MKILMVVAGVLILGLGLAVWYLSSERSTLSEQVARAKAAQAEAVLEAENYETAWAERRDLAADLERTNADLAAKLKETRTQLVAATELTATVVDTVEFPVHVYPDSLVGTFEDERLSARSVFYPKSLDGIMNYQITLGLAFHHARTADNKFIAWASPDPPDSRVRLRFERLEYQLPEPVRIKQGPRWGCWVPLGASAYAAGRDHLIVAGITGLAALWKCSR